MFPRDPFHWKLSKPNKHVARKRQLYIFLVLVCEHAHTPVVQSSHITMLDQLLAIVKKNRFAVSVAVPTLVLVVLWKRGWIRVKHLALLALAYFIARYYRSKSKVAAVSEPVSSKEISTFDDARDFVGKCANLANEERLAFYGLYKQITTGDCQKKRPRTSKFARCVSARYTSPS